MTTMLDLDESREDPQELFHDLVHIEPDEWEPLHYIDPDVPLDALIK